MKPIKWLLSHLAACAFASAWWAAAVFGGGDARSGASLLWVLAAIMTFLTVVFFCLYLAYHWDDK